MSWIDKIPEWFLWASAVVTIAIIVYLLWIW